MDEWVRKPEGGYVLVPAWAIVAAWNGYRKGSLRFGDVRIFLASFEVRARRCRVRAGCRPRWAAGELAGVAGLRDLGRATAGVRRLEASGLLTWCSDGPRTPVKEPAELRDTTPTPEQRLLLTNERRRVPIPRRTLRRLCTATRPVLLATALGHLLRCVYWRRLGVSARGLCKAGWVAELFGVDARNVKAARGQLESIGLLRREATPQRVLNRWGQAVIWNLAWKPRSEESPPPRQARRRGSPPPIETGISLREMRNQQPAYAARGAFGHGLGRIERSDLDDCVRLRELHVVAAAVGLVSDGEAGRLRMFAAAARARRVGTSNPAGLFATIVSRGLWHHLSARDEDRGLRFMLSGGRSNRSRRQPAAPESTARVVATLMRSLSGKAKGGYREPMPSPAGEASTGSGPSPMSTQS